jgi:hypothetical protein
MLHFIRRLLGLKIRQSPKKSEEGRNLKRLLREVITQEQHAAQRQP